MSPGERRLFLGHLRRSGGATGYDFEHVNDLEPTKSGKAIRLALFSVSVALIAWVAKNAGLPTIVSVIIDVFAVSGAAAAVINAIGG